jgi:hypothetical protein
MIDWLGMEVRVTGHERIMPQQSGNMISWQLEASRNADQKNLQNFIDGMKYLQVDAYRFADEVLRADLEANERIYRYYDQIKAESITYGVKDVTISKLLPFFGQNGFASILYKAGKDTGNFRFSDGYVFSTPFTGVVIDARGLNRKPALSPRIFDQDHNLVYSADLMKPDYFAQWGSVQYTIDPYYARHADRVGDKPLRIMAVRDDKLIATDIAIFSDDARTLLQNSETRRNLEEGRVVVIVDEGWGL